MPVIVLLALLLPLAVFVPRAAHADCPPSISACNDEMDWQYLDAPVWERVCSAASPRVVGAQDATAGRVRTERSGTGPGWGTEVMWVDEYTILNVEPGTAITCRARLLVDGFTDMPAEPPPGDETFASIVIGIGNADGSVWNTLEIHPLPGSGFVPLPADGGGVSLEAIAGQPFVLRVQLLHGGGGGAELTARLQLWFDELPPTADVYGCKGFRQFAGVPAGATSWGALKIRYR